MSKTALTKKSRNERTLKSLSKIVGSLAFAVGLFLTTVIPSTASDKRQFDDVYINGYKLGFFEQLALEDHIDRDIADGEYWFEMSTGMWGPVGGTAIGRIIVPEDYREYVRVRLFKPGQPARAELAASTVAAAKDDRLYVKRKHSKPSRTTKAELPASVAKSDRSYDKRKHSKPGRAEKVKLAASAKDKRHYVKKRKRSKPSHAEKVILSASNEKCNKACLKIFILELVTALSPRL